MLFTASIDNSFDNSSCENETYEYRPLSEANVHWTYKKGDKTIDMGYQNVETFRQSILASFEVSSHHTEQLGTDHSKTYGGPGAGEVQKKIFAQGKLK